jgi:hypothetical protein
MAKKTKAKQEFEPLHRRYKPELFATTIIGSRYVDVYLAQGFGSGGLMCEIADQQRAIVLINRSYQNRPQVLLDLLIHELTHVVELVFFEHRITEFGGGIEADCNPAVQSIGTGLAQAFAELTPIRGSKLALLKKLGLV